MPVFVVILKFLDHCLDKEMTIILTHGLMKMKCFIPSCLHCIAERMDIIEASIHIQVDFFNIIHEPFLMRTSAANETLGSMYRLYVIALLDHVIKITVRRPNTFFNQAFSFILLY